MQLVFNGQQSIGSYVMLELHSAEHVWGWTLTQGWLITEISSAYFEKLTILYEWTEYSSSIEWGQTFQYEWWQIV